ncbi:MULTISPECIES: hypothetical protein [Streptacidiphilus]|uniref:Uncharacterized protein n=2 Tax=Streptacidiphilus TaxID=228398 RepID=A0ABV6URG6_9ACTN|nr:hypothetical protein [Streptacidiphilus jeojiense]
MKQLANRLGKTLAFVLPVILVTTGTLAVTRVPWAPSGSGDQQVLAASSSTSGNSSDAVRQQATTPQDALRARLLQTLRTQDPGAALDQLAQAMQQQPSLTRYCTDLARDLGQAAVRKYQGDVKRAQSFARPVCDGSFAVGTLSAAG